MRTRVILTAIFSLIVGFAPQTQAVGPAVDHATDLILILDASGSMWGQIQGEAKIDIARKTLKKLVTDLEAGTTLGMVAYGHRHEGDCTDIETVIPIGPIDKAKVSETIDRLSPKGKTPITASILAALDSIKSRDRAATVILVSDGIETCGGDPCATVTAAKKQGVELVMHVVGFDVDKAAASQLECTAKAGGGMYFDAHDAGELASALERVVKVPETKPEPGPARLSVKTTVEGKPHDCMVKVFRTGTKEAIAHSRTYTGEKTNPRLFPLEAGTYDIEVTALSLNGDTTQRIDGVLIEDGLIEKAVDFSVGEMAIHITRNGALSDATVNVTVTDAKGSVAAGRTYTSPSSNPKIFRITPGSYVVVVGSVEIKNASKHTFENVVVRSEQRVERSHDFKSGEISVGAVKGDELIDAVVKLYDTNTRESAGGSRTYTSESSNPRSFVVTPGTYEVTVKPMKKYAKGIRTFEMVVEAGGSAERIIDFGAP